MNKAPFLALLSLTLLTTRAAPATVETIPFSVDVTSGSETSSVYNGAFTFDADALPGNPFTPVLSLDFDAPDWSGLSLSSPGISHADAFQIGSQVYLDLFLAPGRRIQGFSIYSTEFLYGTSIYPNGFVLDGKGTISYGTPSYLTTTPEPRTMFSFLSALGIAIFATWRSRRSMEPGL